MAPSARNSAQSPPPGTTSPRSLGLRTSAGRAEQDAAAERTVADVKSRIEIDDDVEQWRRLDRGDGFDA